MLLAAGTTTPLGNSIIRRGRHPAQRTGCMTRALPSPTQSQQTSRTPAGHACPPAPHNKPTRGTRRVLGHGNRFDTCSTCGAAQSQPVSPVRRASQLLHSCHFQTHCRQLLAYGRHCILCQGRRARNVAKLVNGQQGAHHYHHQHQLWSSHGLQLCPAACYMRHRGGRGHHPCCQTIRGHVGTPAAAVAASVRS